MAVSGIAGMNITGTLSNGSYAMESAKDSASYNDFMNLVESMKAEKSDSAVLTNVSSSQIGGRRLNGDYTEGFAGTFTSEADKHAKPQGAAARAYYGNKSSPEIDKTSALYEQAMELENYMVKSMLSSMRNTIQKSGLYGSDNDYAQNMYEDMLYDNYAEQLTKTANFGLADQIYLELSGQR